MVYTIHFDTPLAHGAQAPTRHYTGFTDDLDARLEAHRTGRGARLMEVITQAGIPWRLASTVPGGRTEERRLKQHSAARRCPICKAEAAR